MDTLKTLQTVALFSVAILLTIWAIRAVEYRLRPEGVRKSFYSVDTRMGV